MFDYHSLAYKKTFWKKICCIIFLLGASSNSYAQTKEIIDKVFEKRNIELDPDGFYHRVPIDFETQSPQQKKALSFFKFLNSDKLTNYALLNFLHQFNNRKSVRISFFHTGDKFLPKKNDYVAGQYVFQVDQIDSFLEFVKEKQLFLGDKFLPYFRFGKNIKKFLRYYVFVDFVRDPEISSQINFQVKIKFFEPSSREEGNIIPSTLNMEVLTDSYSLGQVIAIEEIGAKFIPKEKRAQQHIRLSLKAHLRSSVKVVQTEYGNKKFKSSAPRKKTITNQYLHLYNPLQEINVDFAFKSPKDFDIELRFNSQKKVGDLMVGRSSLFFDLSELGKRQDFLFQESKELLDENLEFSISFVDEFNSAFPQALEEAYEDLKRKHPQYALKIQEIKEEQLREFYEDKKSGKYHDSPQDFVLKQYKQNGMYLSFIKEGFFKREFRDYAESHHGYDLELSSKVNSIVQRCSGTFKYDGTGNRCLSNTSVVTNRINCVQRTVERVLLQDPRFKSSYRKKYTVGVYGDLLFNLSLSAYFQRRPPNSAAAKSKVFAYKNFIFDYAFKPKIDSPKDFYIQVFDGISLKPKANQFLHLCLDLRPDGKGGLMQFSFYEKKLLSGVFGIGASNLNIDVIGLGATAGKDGLEGMKEVPKELVRFLKESGEVVLDVTEGANDLLEIVLGDVARKVKSGSIQITKGLFKQILSVGVNKIALIPAQNVGTKQRPAMVKVQVGAKIFFELFDKASTSSKFKYPRIDSLFEANRF